MNKAISRDGTPIAYENRGDGSPPMLVDGAMCSRTFGPNGPPADRSRDPLPEGGKSPAWMRSGIQTLAKMLPNVVRRTLEGQTHIVKPAALAPMLRDFFESKQEVYNL